MMQLLGYLTSLITSVYIPNITEDIWLWHCTFVISDTERWEAGCYKDSEKHPRNDI